MRPRLKKAQEISKKVVPRKEKLKGNGRLEEGESKGISSYN